MAWRRESWLEVKGGTSALSRPERPRAGAESGGRLSDVSQDVQGIILHIQHIDGRVQGSGAQTEL